MAGPDQQHPGTRPPTASPGEAEEAGSLALKTYTLYFLVAAIVLGMLLFLAIKRTAKLCCWDFIYGVRRAYPTVAKNKPQKTLDSQDGDTPFRAPSVLTTLQDRYDKRQSLRSKSTVRSSVAPSEFTSGSLGSASHKSRIQRYLDLAINSVSSREGRNTGRSSASGAFGDEIQLVPSMTSREAEEPEWTVSADDRDSAKLSNVHVAAPPPEPDADPDTQSAHDSGIQSHSGSGRNYLVIIPDPEVEIESPRVSTEGGDDSPPASSSHFDIDTMSSDTNGNKYGTYASIGGASSLMESETQISMDPSSGHSRRYKKRGGGSVHSSRGGSHRAIKKVVGIL